MDSAQLALSCISDSNTKRAYPSVTFFPMQLSYIVSISPASCKRHAKLHTACTKNQSSRDMHALHTQDRESSAFGHTLGIPLVGVAHLRLNEHHLKFFSWQIRGRQIGETRLVETHAHLKCDQKLKRSFPLTITSSSICDQKIKKHKIITRTNEIID